MRGRWGEREGGRWRVRVEERKFAAATNKRSSVTVPSPLLSGIYPSAFFRRGHREIITSSPKKTPPFASARVYSALVFSRNPSKRFGQECRESKSPGFVRFNLQLRRARSAASDYIGFKLPLGIAGF